MKFNKNEKRLKVDSNKPVTLRSGARIQNSISSAVRLEIIDKKKKVNLNKNFLNKKIRKFDSGATRNLDNNKLDYEGFLNPLVLEEFAKYMNLHRKQKDGTIRDSDNWQKGIPKEVYMKSMWRHFLDFWKMHRRYKAINPDNNLPFTKKELLSALMFNIQGYLYELIKEENKKIKNTEFI